MASGYTIVIADARDVPRRGWSSIFSNYGDIASIYEAANKDELEALLRTTSFDLLFIHQSLVTDPSLLPRNRFVLLVTEFDVYLFQMAHHYAARGYLLENTAPELLLATLVLPDGAFLIEPGISVEIIQYLSHDRKFDVQDDLLTPREREIVDMLRRGSERADIVKELNISKSTLKTHIRNIQRKREEQHREADFLTASG